MNELAHLAEFQAVLQNYHINPAGRELLAETPFLLLLAPSSGGRNTIITELVKTGRYYYIVSDTTRQPRINNGQLEQNGREYWFRSEEEMLQEIRDGQMLEAEIIHQQQVSGMSLREVKKAHDQGKIVVTDIDLGGIQNVMDAKPDTKAVLVLPPNFEEWLRRLKSRGAMSNDELVHRLQTAEKIFAAAQTDDRYCLVVNDELAAAVEEIDAYAREDTRPPQAERQQLVGELLTCTHTYIQELS